MKNVLENIAKSIVIILVWDTIDLIMGNSMSIKENIIGFIVIFIVGIIIDLFKISKSK